MKYIIGMMALLTVFTPGCSKHDTSPKKTNETLIAGKWTIEKETYKISYKDGTPPDISNTSYDPRSYVDFKSNGKYIFVLYETNIDAPILNDTSGYKISGNNLIITTIDVNNGGAATNETDSIETLTGTELILYNKDSDPTAVSEDWKYFKR